jgi:hypothetical protein
MVINLEALQAGQATTGLTDPALVGDDLLDVIRVRAILA